MVTYLKENLSTNHNQKSSMDKETKISTLKARIKDKEKNISELVEKREEIKDEIAMERIELKGLNIALEKLSKGEFDEDENED